MIVVSDTTPLNYLILIQMESVLPRLFREVLVPQSVVHEMLHPKAPASVRNWALTPPSWVKIAAPVTNLQSTLLLDKGEADAISLAKERGINEVLIDERAGRKIATEEGLLVVPTIAILERADVLGYLDFAAAIRMLQQTNFHAPADRIAAALKRAAARKNYPSGQSLTPP